MDAVPGRAVRAGRAPLVAVVLLAVGLLGAALLLHLRGGAWYVVETPSMGTAAPVGTLVITAPVALPAVRVGDVITYAPPTGAAGTITHRVVALSADAVRTRGDVNGGDDPWKVRASEVRGRAVALIPGLGWLVRGLPLLLGGTAVTLALSALIRDRVLRSAARLVGVSVVVSVVAIILRPLVNAAAVSVMVAPTSTAVSVVGTGLLPVRVSTDSGRSVDLVAGQLDVLHLPAGTSGLIQLHTALHMQPLGWGAFAAVCAAPLLVAVLQLRGSRSA